MDKREDILKAALALFAERGYHGTPVSLIAHQAKVGSGTIYRYFRDKDDLVNTLYRHWKQVMADQIMEQIDPQRPIRSLFRQLTLALADFAMTHREAFLFMEAHHHSPYLDDESKALCEQINERFLAPLRMGQEQEFIKPGPPELLKSVVFGIFSEMMKKHYSGEQPLTKELILQVEEMSWQAIRR